VTVAADPPTTSTRPGLAGWFRAKDPQLVATKRSVRAAVVLSGLFAIAHVAFADPQVSLFASFGSFALMLLVDFAGPPRSRLVCYLALFAVGCVFVTLGTAASTDEVAAVVTMAVIGFAVLFAGVAAPEAATASTAALLTFVLPVAVAAPVSEIGPRLVGFALAGAASIPVCLFVWPARGHDGLRRRLSSTLSAVGRLAAGGAAGSRDGTAGAEVDRELHALQAAFAATPYPPTGASAGAAGLAMLVGRTEWLAQNAMLGERDPGGVGRAAVRPILESVAETLEGCARLVDDGDGSERETVSVAEHLRTSTLRLHALVHRELDAEVSGMLSSGERVDRDRSAAPQGSEVDERLETLLDPAFHARALGIATGLAADAALEAAGKSPTGALEPPEGVERDLPHLWTRLRGYLSFQSVWFRNSVRGAAGLALAVAVAEVTNVEHGFWVVLGTLAVLRSNALGTGSTAIRAIGGTAVGFVIGSLLLVGIGSHTAALWALLPVAVLLAGMAPSLISFAAGQAGFTVMVVILFNIIQPQGWRVGLTRIEDVAIGCAVSIVVGLLFWPRGAAAALGRALAEAFVANSAYLSDAVDRLVTSDREVDTGPAYRVAHRCYLRADDAFRQFLGERGSKTVPIETVSKLVSGANRIRLGAYTLASLPTLTLEAGRPELESVAVAGAVLRDAYAAGHRWYEGFAELLAGRREALAPAEQHDRTVHHVLREALDDARARGRRDRLRVVLRMLWADQLLESQRGVQADLAGAAVLFAGRSHPSLL
jgi:hypothetical protein